MTEEQITRYARKLSWFHRASRKLCRKHGFAALEDVVRHAINNNKMYGASDVDALVNQYQEKVRNNENLKEMYGVYNTEDRHGSILTVVLIALIGAVIKKVIDKIINK